MCVPDQHVGLGLTFDGVQRFSKVIRPRLAAIQQLNPRCLEFFDRRKGYIEIVRNGALERVFFQVPKRSTLNPKP